MKALYVISACIALAGCQGKTNPDRISDSTAVDSISRMSPAVTSASIDQPIYSFQLNSSDFSALILSGTGLSSDSTEDASIAMYAGSVQAATVISKSTLTYPPQMDLCDQSRWYLVRLEDQNTGWVTGDRLLQKAGAPTWQDHFEYQGQTFTIGFLRPTTMGASDTRGLTGCTEYAVLYLFDEAGKTIHFLKNDAAQLEAITGTYNGWFGLLSGEAGGGSITSLEPGATQNEVLRLHLRYGYQEGGGQAILHIESMDGLFSVVTLEPVEETN